MKGEKAIRVFIAEIDRTELEKLRNSLTEKGIDVVGTAKSGQEAVWGVLKTGADVLLTNFVLEGDDGLAVCRRLKERENCPVVIIMFPYISGYLSTQIATAEPDCFFIKPINSDKLVGAISDCVNYRQSICLNGSFDFEGRISEILKDMGIPAKLLGYHYIYSALLSTADSRLCLYGPIKELYRRIAKKYNSTPQRVERNIRSAIEIAFDRCDPETLEHYFGNTVSLEKGKLTNSEFLFSLGQMLVLEAGKRKTVACGRKNM